MIDDDAPIQEIIARQQELVEEISTILEGKGRLAQGAALCDLLAMWLAGHFADTEENTAKLREKLLQEFNDIARKLIPVNEKILLERTKQSAS